MKAMIPDRHGSVRLDEVAEPSAQSDEAVVAVQAYSVNRGETFVLAEPPVGWRPGKDVSGEVVTAAADGSGPAAGQRVVGYAQHSGWAERVTVSVSSLALLPDEVSGSDAATLPLAGFTAMRLIRAAGPLLGRRLLITGASGGVGHFLVELATAAGAEVTAVSSTSERSSRLRELGAHTVTDVDAAEGWFDLAMESVGGASFTSARRKVKPSGTVLWFGQASMQPVTLDFFDYVQDTLGARVEPFDHTRSDRTNAEDLATLVRLVEEGRLHPEVGVCLPWQRTPDVIDDIRARRLRGNAVLTLV